MKLWQLFVAIVVAATLFGIGAAVGTRHRNKVIPHACIEALDSAEKVAHDAGDIIDAQARGQVDKMNAVNNQLTEDATTYNVTAHDCRAGSG